MKNKIILACAFFAILIAIGINSFAANNTTAQSLINSTINGTASAVNSTSNVVSSGINSTTNVVTSGTTATTNGIKAASNSVANSMNTMAGVTKADAASATFLGISSVIWMWIMVIIIAIVIIMLVVKYVKERH